MSHTAAQHRKPSRFSPAHSSMPARHRKPSPITSALQHKPARLAAAVAGSTLIASGASPPTHWPSMPPRPANVKQADAVSSLGASVYLGAHASRLAAAGLLKGRAAAGFPARSGSTAHVHGQRLQAPAARRAAQRPQPRHSQRRTAAPAPAPAVYLNPLRGISGLIPERIDMGVDIGGSGPIYALGNAVITNAMGNSAGWPGGGWITYRLTDGPDSGLMVYVAEDVTPTVQVGRNVSSSTVIANMFAGGAGIETGWAQPSGDSAESQLPAAASISGGGGPFPTRIGLNFEELLQTLGVAAASNRTQPAYGTLPPGYPAD